jgi:NADP-dependent 3-hydroxy acid dehydrogenase YdfG
VNPRGAIVVITGASSGIGRATAIAFARAGSSLVLAARREDRLRELADEIEGHGGRAMVLPSDVTRPEDVAALRDGALAAFGRCDVLVNDAGVPGGGPFADASWERIELIVRTNLLGLRSVT